MNYTHWLVIASIIISIGGASAYIRDTVKGITKPNRVSWSMWALAPLVGASTAISAQADFWATARIFLAGLLPLIIFLASFANSKSYCKLTPFDIACGAFSFLALLAWLGVNSPITAILLAATGDGLASLPTIKKAWLYPETETKITYIASFVSLILIIPSIPVWNIENAAFQTYLLIANALLLIAVYRKNISEYIHRAF